VPPNNERPTLHEFAGGMPAFLALAAAHHARCLADPELNHPFSHPGQNPRHVERLAAYWAEVMGGPADPEFRAALRAYMEWAVHDVALSHPHDSDIPLGLPVPRWSWDGLQTEL
jgi:hemoglobin